MTTLLFRLKCSEILGHSDKHPYILSAPIFPLISYSFLWILNLSWAPVSFPSSRRTFLNGCGTLHLDIQLPLKCNKSKPSTTPSLLIGYFCCWCLHLLTHLDISHLSHLPISAPHILSFMALQTLLPEGLLYLSLACQIQQIQDTQLNLNFRKIDTFLAYIYIYQLSCSVMSHSLRPHEPQHARPPCPSPTPWVYPNSCPLNRWCHLTISSSVVPFSSCLQSFPTSGSFPRSQPLTSGGQNTEVSASTSVLAMNTQDWFPLGWTGWISLQSKGLSRVFSTTTVQKHPLFGAQLSF